METREPARTGDSLRDTGRRGSHALALFPNLARARAVLHFVTTRRGGISAPPYDTFNLGFHVGDDPSAVLEHRRRLCRALGISLDALTCAQQCHGNEVAFVTESERGRGARNRESALPAVDALVTDRPNVCVAVLVADCVPVLLLDPRRRAVAAVHAGWRGTSGLIVGRTVAFMRDRLGCDPSDMLAAIGPAIDGPHYEVGPEVAGAIRAAMGESAAGAVRDGPGDRSTVDLAEANRIQLLAAGVQAEAIEACGVSTYLRADNYYSARAAAGPTGRFAAGIMLRT